MPGAHLQHLFFRQIRVIGVSIGNQQEFTDMLSALELHFSDPREIAIVGDLKDERTRALRQTALSCFQPNTVFAYAEGLEDPASERVPLLAGKGLVDGRPAAYVCSNFACQTPITDAARLHDALSEPSVRIL